MVFFSSRSIGPLAVLPIIAGSPMEKRAGIKAGFSWPKEYDSSHAKTLVSDTLSWYMTWDTTRRVGNGEFVPMVWGRQPAEESVPDIPEGTSTVLSINEPDGCYPNRQACITDIDDAVYEHTRSLGPLKEAGYRIGSPAVSGSLEWLDQFMTACEAKQGCPVPDFLQAHIYQTDVTAFKQYLEDMHSRWPDKKIWVTEYCCHNFGGAPPPSDIAQVKAFMGETTTYMRDQAFVERFAWFGSGKIEHLGDVSPLNRLQNDDDSLTELGEKYLYDRNS